MNGIGSIMLSAALAATTATATAPSTPPATPEQAARDPAPTAVVEPAPAVPAPALPEPPPPPPPAPPERRIPPSSTGEERRNRTLERELDRSLDELEEGGSCEPEGPVVMGLLFGGAAIWVASETDVRGTWAVLLGELSAMSLGSAVVRTMFPGDEETCTARFRAMPSDDAGSLAERVAVGRLCLEESADRGLALRLGDGVVQVAVAGGVVLLWSTDRPAQRDDTLLVIAAVTGLLSFTHLFPSDAERGLDAFERVEALAITPTATVDSAGAPSPGLALSFRY